MCAKPYGKMAAISYNNKILGQLSKFRKLKCLFVECEGIMDLAIIVPNELEHQRC